MPIPPDSSPPPGSPTDAKAAVGSPVSAAREGFRLLRELLANHLANVRLAARIRRRESEVALLREELRIKDAYLAQIPPSQPPDEPPTDD